MQRITERADLIALAQTPRVRPDWHEPGEQEVTATFDNAGFWGEPGETYKSSFDGTEFTEQYVTLHKDGVPVAAVNLATLFAWATGLED